MFALSRNIHRSFFPDHGYFNLSGIGHFVLDLLGHIKAQLFAVVISHFICFHNHPQFTAGLDGIGFFNTW